MRPALSSALAFGSAAALVSFAAATADVDVQRQLQQREQQQTELRLKMQQQQDRAAQPTPGLGLHHRQVERDQQLRLQQLHDQQLRGTIAPGTPESVQRDIERRRAQQAGTEQLNRFGNERRMAEPGGTLPPGAGP